MKYKQNGPAGVTTGAAPMSSMHVHSAPPPPTAEGGFGHYQEDRIREESERRDRARRRQVQDALRGLKQRAKELESSRRDTSAFGRFWREHLSTVPPTRAELHDLRIVVLARSEAGS